MKKIIITLFFALFSMVGFAQMSIESALAEIEANNTTLKTLRQSVEAQKLENRSGIFLPNPEVGFNYLWGTPRSEGNRMDLSLSQSFDIPTLSGLKRKTANEMNSSVDWQYRVDRMAIMLEAKNLLIELTYYNALIKELDVRLAQAVVIENGFKNRFERGDVGKLEYNNVRLNLASIRGEMQRLKTEQTMVASQLKRLNGGLVLSYGTTSFSDLVLESDFDSWYVVAESKSPVLAYVKQEIEVSKRQLSLSKSMSYPTFRAGYMSETIAGTRLDGVSVGLSLPLWENTNRVKQARAALAASQAREEESKQQFYNQLEILYNRALGLSEAAQLYRLSLKDANNSELLKRALDAGQISMLDYMVEMGIYYESITKALEAERDFALSVAELNSYTL